MAVPSPDLDMTSCVTDFGFAGSSDVGIQVPREEVISVATFLSNSSLEMERRKSTGNSTSDAGGIISCYTHCHTKNIHKLHMYVFDPLQLLHLLGLADLLF